MRREALGARGEGVGQNGVKKDKAQYFISSSPLRSVGRRF